jgi:hypothetical protein
LVGIWNLEEFNLEFDFRVDNFTSIIIFRVLARILFDPSDTVLLGIFDRLVISAVKV